jgi:hypothetical protein
MPCVNEIADIVAFGDDLRKGLHDVDDAGLRYGMGWVVAWNRNCGRLEKGCADSRWVFYLSLTTPTHLSRKVQSSVLDIGTFFCE